MATDRRPRSSVHLAAGLATGVLSAALLQPADLLKTRVQQAGAAPLGATLRAIVAQPAPARQLWRGTLPSVLRTGLGSALYFTSLSQLRALLARAAAASSSSSAGLATASSTLPSLGPGANLAAGAAARTFAGMVLMPLTVVKVRCEAAPAGQPATPSPRAAARAIFSAHGARGFFAGAGATALRDAPYAGLYVLFYEGAKARLGALVTARQAPLQLAASGSAAAAGGVADRKLLLPPSLAAPVNFAAGVGAAAAATALTNPFDAVKTRIQLEPTRYRNLVVAAVRMVREDGWRCLMDGVGLRMGRKALSSAIAWTLYEELVRIGEAKGV